MLGTTFTFCVLINIRTRHFLRPTRLLAEGVTRLRRQSETQIFGFTIVKRTNETAQSKGPLQKTSFQEAEMLRNHIHSVLHLFIDVDQTRFCHKPDVTFGCRCTKIRENNHHSVELLFAYHIFDCLPVAEQISGENFCRREQILLF
jgi:hypothetical protein